MSADDVTAYMKAHALPEHPLKARRYLSIGCQPCAEKNGGPSAGAASLSRPAAGRARLSLRSGGSHPRGGSPGLDLEIGEFARHEGILAIPGALTPTGSIVDVPVPVCIRVLVHRLDSDASTAFSTTLDARLLAPDVLPLPRSEP